MIHQFPSSATITAPPVALWLGFLLGDRANIHPLRGQRYQRLIDHDRQSTALQCPCVASGLDLAHLCDQAPILISVSANSLFQCIY
jgi:hypothetical protein